MRLKGRVALITRAGEDIGAAVARRFAKEGALVAVYESSLSTAERIAHIIKKEKGIAFPVKGDVCDREEVDSMIKQIVEKWDRIDILINNIAIRQDEPFLNMAFKTWQEIIEIHLNGCFNTIQSVARHMPANQYGRIVNILADQNIDMISKNESANSMTANSGIKGMTYALAKELGRYGITVNCVIPEFIDTEMLRNSVRPEGLYREDLRPALSTDKLSTSKADREDARYSRHGNHRRSE
jgi:3-oxoacyl-[acyl-carrier protein] reductase